MGATTAVFFITVLVFISGCATTQPIQKGKDLSTSGIAYADAVNGLLDVTSDRVIDFDSMELIKSRRGPDPRMMIIEKNKAVADLIKELGRFQSQTKLLKAYFINLQALADSTVKDDAGGAVQSLSDSISKLNKKLGGKDGKESLTEDQKKQIGAIGGIVATSIQAEKVKHALTRDAEIISVYLALQEEQLKNIADLLGDRFSAENDLFLNQEVIGPYVNKDIALGEKWVTNRKQWLKSQFIIQQLSTAQEAAKQLRGVWVDILQGKTDVNSLRALFSDVNEFVTTVQALDASGKAK
jgi:hypothetical protein